MNTIEVVFYIHGVSPDPRGAPHQEQYETLHRGVAAAAGDASLWPTHFGGAEWGWNFDKGQATSHKALADAQRIFGGQVLPLVDREVDLGGVVPLKALRRLVLHGFGDMFYYVSNDGKAAVRNEVGRQLKAHVDRRRVGDAAISLTLVGHSAGSVIAFDFLFYLFKQDEPSWVHRELKALRAERQAGRLRLRRLITLGSPISFLMFRNDPLVERLARREPSAAADYGFESALEGDALAGPRWINLWDKHDLIAWPVAPVMDSPLVEDVYVDVSDSVHKAHNAYWRSKKLHRVIAARW